MNNSYLNIEDLVAKHLAGESTPAEDAMLNKWMEESEDNRQYFMQLEKLFKESAAANAIVDVDTDAAWINLKQKLNRDNKPKLIDFNKPVTGSRGQKNNYRLLLRIAAAIAFVALTATVYVFYFKDRLQTVNYAAINEPKTILLPDSTTVLLNRYTTLAFSYNNKQRQVEFSGEAFFEIKHDNERPFVIQLNELTIEDIGTSFNVKAPAGSDSVQVIVTEGLVKLSSPIDADYNFSSMLRPGQQAVYSHKTKTIKATILADTNALAYKTKVFVFENASLPSAAQKLMEVYNVKITIAKPLNDCHITATFKNEKIDAVMEVIATTLNLKLTISGNDYKLEGEGCDE